MSEIQILSTEVINQIAAGEVVERPSHLVKELIENSLDAGSTEISIEVALGGKYVRIFDNGHGIESEDLEKALQRHATSKISKTNDLWNLSTFGFRGEALASVAAVSKMTLTSRKQNANQAYQVVSVFGEVSTTKPSGQISGTDIKVENLFENVPARLKFLKSDATEISQIKSVIKAMSLSYPHVQFKFTNDGKLEFFYNKKKSYLERSKEVFEIKDLYAAELHRNGYQAQAVFASPQQVAKTAKNIWIFCQGRWVQDRAIQAAIMDAFRSLLMHGEYPIVSVWITCPPDQIDVNIHPTKSQVKFQDASFIFKLVQSCLREAIEKAPWIPKASGASTSVANAPSSFGYATHITYENQKNESAKNLKFFDSAFQLTQFKNKNLPTTENYSALKIEPTFFEKQNSQEIIGENFWSQLQVIGQANLTYIVCQKADRLVYVDQHAAHERVVYESLMEAFKNGKFEIQEYLFPLTVDLSPEKIEALMRVENEIHKLGVSIEQMGPETIGVKATPSLLKDSALPSVLENLAQDVIDHGGSFVLEKKVSDIMATLACHSVIRAGQSLSLPEMQQLLKSMDQYRLSSFCPHGRPVSVEVTFNELEKLFGRIS